MSESEHEEVPVIVNVVDTKRSRKTKIVKKKRTHVWTEKNREAFEKCRAKRLENLRKRKEAKNNVEVKETSTDESKRLTV